MADVYGDRGGVSLATPEMKTGDSGAGGGRPAPLTVSGSFKEGGESSWTRGSMRPSLDADEFINRLENEVRDKDGEIEEEAQAEIKALGLSERLADEEKAVEGKALEKDSFAGERNALLLAAIRDSLEKDSFATKRNTLLVAATLFAAMAFQAAQNPPGGFFTDNVRNEEGNIITTILLIVSGFPTKGKIGFGLLTATMWVTIGFMAATFLMIMLGLPMTTDMRGGFYSLLLWAVIIMTLLLWGAFRFVRWGIRELQKCRKKMPSIEV